MTKHYTHRTLFEQFLAQRKDFSRTTFFGILATLLLLPIPLLIPLLIDEILLGHPGKMTEVITQIFGYDEAWFLVSVTALLVLFLRMGAFVSTNKKSYHATKITQKISYLLRHRIIHHLEHLSLSEYETLKSGGIASKTVQDVEGVSSFSGQFANTFISASLMLIGIATVMLWMNWMLALLVFILNPLFLSFSRILGRKTREFLTRKYTAYELYQELLNETLDLFVQVRASNQERHFFGLIQDRAKEIERASVEYGYQATVAQGSSTLLTHTVVDIFRALAVVAVVYSDLSVGMMIAFLFYLSTLVSPVQQLMGLMISFQQTKPALDRINQLFSLSQEPHYPHNHNPFEAKKSSAITVKDLTFAYPNGKEVLHGVNLHAKEGQKIAIIGASGSGKSTIAQVLVGLYEAKSGEILYDDIPIEQIGLPVVRENVALMLQESLFFNDTIRMNLTLSSKVRDEEIYKALGMAKLDAFVKGLDEGLETRIGKNGIRLSGGQKQRLAIARLILSDPKVVIFDEATSALDNETESQLYEALSPFLEGRTTLIIAHRATTIRQADTIYLIEEGKVKAEGEYADLQAQGLIREDFDVA